MNSILTILSVLVKGLLEWLAPLLAYRQGRRDKEAERDREDVKVLKRQRDNNVTSIADADSKWVRIRKEHRK